MSEDRRQKAEEFKKANAAEKKAEEKIIDGEKRYLDVPTGDWVSKGELKKREKMRKKEQADAEKAAAKAAKEEQKAGDGGAKKEKVKVGGDDVLDPTKYTENRKNFIQAQRDEGKNPYPHKFNRDMTIP